MSYFSKNLRYLRGEYSQQVIVNRINRKLPEGMRKISQQAYDTWEKERFQPNAKYLPYIAEALGAELSLLVTEDLSIRPKTISSDK